MIDINTDINVIILAAGHGSRMKSNTPKVLHEVMGKAMIDWVLESVSGLNAKNLITIIGTGADKVSEHLNGRSKQILQEKQLGTGHAVLQAKEALKDSDGVTLIMSGDTPMFRAETLLEFVKAHMATRNAATVLTANAPDPTGYGRIVRGDDDSVLKIVEQKDASATERRIHEINTGVYVFENQKLFAALEKVTNDNAQEEYYLPDTLDILRKESEQIGAYTLHDFTESLGVNDRVALATASEVMRNRINNKLMQAGIEMQDPHATYIDADVVIGKDSYIEANTQIKGNTRLGEACYIASGTTIVDSEIKNNVEILHSYIENAVIEDNVTIGPFAHLRSGTKLAENVHIGNFVETKNASLGKNTKSGHLTYIGDAEIGSEVNIGAGTIFANYDGKKKHLTKIGNRVFIGSNTKLVAPLQIGNESVTAAGSTITSDVLDQQLAIGRSRQVNKDSYWDKMPYKENFEDQND